MSSQALIQQLSKNRLQEILDAIKKTRIAVIGDFCLDVYWTIDLSASEISLETGKKTQPVYEQRYSLGGAGNVVANLRDLGVDKIHAFGIVGQDPFGEKMLDLLKTKGILVENMLRGEKGTWQTLAYCKPYVGEEELPRIDMGNFNQLTDSVVTDLLQCLQERLGELDVVIINQQVKSGIHTSFFQDQLSALLKRNQEKLFIFDGRHIRGKYREAILKINDHEALRSIGFPKEAHEIVMREEALRAASNIFAATGRPVFVTRGSRGCVGCTQTGIFEVPGIQVLGHIDTVGAGDSFLAGLAASLATGAEADEAAQFGNLASVVTITKIGCTGTATPAEVLEIGMTPRYIYDPELADDLRLAKYWQDTDIEIIRQIPQNLRIEYAIFDHDGTISTLRQGWEHVMEPMMVKAILGLQYEAADEALYHKIVQRVRRYIDQTTGIQTLSQMKGLVAMVKEFGFVPIDEILDESGYKLIYNDSLMHSVRHRLHRLKCGELSVQDFSLKNAVPFLYELKNRGVKLYLASGTDVADVVDEAGAMGYADLFEGRIYGAVGKIDKEAKQIVLDRILSEIGSVGGKLVTFGDGPVEIRETLVRGGIPIGVASDEVRRYELNPEKRTRLIRAGASVIIPDFSQMDKILKLFSLN